MTYNRCNEWKDNLSLFESAAINTPNSARVTAGLATEYMNLAEKEMDATKRTELISNSINFFKKSIDILPSNAKATYSLGLIYEMISDSIQSRKYYHLCLDYNPNYVFALNNIASGFAGKQQYDSALFYLNRSYIADSLNDMTLTNLVVVNYLKGNFEKVVLYANRASQLNISNSKIDDLYQKAKLNLK